MPSSKPFVFIRTSADPILEELVIALSDGEWIDFKALFAKVHQELKRKKAGTGTEEVQRLRCYERVLKLVATGLVEKKDKTFRALPGIEQAAHGHAKAASFRRKSEMAQRAVDFE